MKKETKKELNKEMYSKNVLVVVLGVVLISLAVFKIMQKDVAFFQVESRTDNIKSYKLKQSDVEVEGWLRVQGTNIDYPILRNTEKLIDEENNLEYVYVNGEMKKLNKINHILGSNDNNQGTKPVITGKNQTKFEQLMSFTYYDFVKDNKYIQLTIDNKDYIFEIFAVSYPKSSEVSTYTADIYTEEDVQKYVNDELKNSIYKFDTEVDRKDTIISLITNTNMLNSTESRNFRVSAKLVENDSKLDNYNVTKTDKYKEVEKQLKGEK